MLDLLYDEHFIYTNCNANEQQGKLNLSATLAYVEIIYGYRFSANSSRKK